MGLPYKEDNHRGYENARLSTRYNDFRNKTYLLVHGSLDDNVHYQQSMALARSLEVNDIPFEQIVSTYHAFIPCSKNINYMLMLSHILIPFYRLTQTKTIHYGEFGNIYIMRWINISPNVLPQKAKTFVQLKASEIILHESKL